MKSLLGINEDDNSYFYNVTKHSQIKIICKKETIRNINDEIIFDDYTKLTSMEWDLTQEGMLKVLAYKNNDKTLFLLIFHHLFADGRGAFMLANELAACYVSGIKPCPSLEKLISTKKGFPKNSKLSFISNLLIKYANKKWIKENHRVTYKEYLELANNFVANNIIERSIQIIIDNEYKYITDKCHEKKVSLNDYLISKMIVEKNTAKVIIACDLRNELECYNHGALGNYSTAFSIEPKIKTTDIWTLSEKVHTIVQKKINTPKDLYLILQCYAELNGNLLDAAFVSSRCGFKSKAAKFIGNLFFGYSHTAGYSITNLGKYKSEYIEDGVFIPPVSPAIKQTLGVITLNGKMVMTFAERI